MAISFEEKPLQLPGIVARLFSRPVRQNAIVEINNALAVASRCRDVSSHTVQEIIDRYKTKGSDLVTGLVDLYRSAVSHYMKTRTIDDTDWSELEHLQMIFKLDPLDVKACHVQAAVDCLEGEADKIFADHHVSEAEAASFFAILDTLRLNDDDKGRVLKQTVAVRLASMAREALSDERYSPEEEKKLFDAARLLKIDLKISDEDQETFRRFRRYWELENAPLASVPTQINLRKGEVCVFVTSCALAEMRTRTRAVRYGGPAVSVRIAKGIYYRAGGYNIERITEETLHTIDDGQLYLTSRRLIFVGDRGSKTIQLTKVLDFTPYRDGVELQKETGRNPVYRFTQRIDEFCILLARVMKEAA